jgi:phage terminase large subunit GpA-like protein
MTWPDGERLLFDTEWKRANGEEMRVWRAGIDIGGTRKEGELISRSEETMIWAAKNRFRLVGQLFACKGASNPQTKPVKLGEPLDKTPSGKRILKGRQILTIDTAFFKDALVQRREWAAEHLPGAAYLHAETEDWYAKQMAAEVKRRARDGSYEWVRRHPDNHMIDCEVGCFAMVDPGLFGGIERFRSGRPAATGRPVQRKTRAEILAATSKPENDGGNPYLTGGRLDDGDNPYLGGRK